VAPLVVTQGTLIQALTKEFHVINAVYEYILIYPGKVKFATAGPSLSPSVMELLLLDEKETIWQTKANAVLGIEVSDKKG